MKFKTMLLFIGMSLMLAVPLFAQENQLIAPEGWRLEEIKLPLSFAPDIPITGVELVRFAPGWGDPESEEYFSYAFVWFLDESKDLNKDDMDYFLVAYFDGIMGMVGGFDEVGTYTSLEPVGDGFEGELNTLDGFFTKSELNLNVTIEKIDNGNIWFFRLSPMNKDHDIWQVLNTQLLLEE